MPFKFRLSKVLLHRKAVENMARKDYLEANMELQEAKALLEELYQQTEDAQKRRHSLVVEGGSQSESLRQLHDYIKGTEIKIERQKGVVMERMAKVEKMQLALQEASIEYKMIEKLEDRQREEYRKNKRKQEEKETTEMTNARFNLRQKNGG